MASPSMLIDAEQLLDPQTMRDGPMDFLWNQDEWVEPTRPVEVGDEWPRRKLIQRLTRARRWHIAVRLAPPPGEDLEQWGRGIADKLGIPWKGSVPQEGDKAVWLPMTAWARNAGGAMGSAGIAIRRLEGFMLGQVQIRVWRAK